MRKKARQTLHDNIAVPLNLSLPEAAYGIYRIAVANMARAARAVSLERGRDAREFVLCAFGGNGPLHATELAHSLGMKRILIPPSPGLFSAFGLLFADIAHHSLQTYKRPLAELDLDDFVVTLRQMEADAGAGLTGENSVLQRAVDVRYIGQSSELTLSLSDAALQDAQLVHTLGARFADAHERIYGHRAPDDPIEVVNLRVTILSPTATPDIFNAPSTLSQMLSSPQDRRCYFGAAIGWLDVPVCSRNALEREPQAGPLIIEEYDTTILVPPDHTAARDEWGNVVIEAR